MHQNVECRMEKGDAKKKTTATLNFTTTKIQAKIKIGFYQNPRIAQDTLEFHGHTKKKSNAYR